MASVPVVVRPTGVSVVRVDGAAWLRWVSACVERELLEPAMLEVLFVMSIPGAHGWGCVARSCPSRIARPLVA
jgi:hypothetical protein